MEIKLRLFTGKVLQGMLAQKRGQNLSYTLQLGIFHNKFLRIIRRILFPQPKGVSSRVHLCCAIQFIQRCTPVPVFYSAGYSWRFSIVFHGGGNRIQMLFAQAGNRTCVVCAAVGLAHHYTKAPARMKDILAE